MRTIRASRLFALIEDAIPLSLAVEGDQVGFIGPGDPDDLDVEQVVVSMDYLTEPGSSGSGEYDLLILHHPPSQEPEVPAYVVHSNWDMLRGGACDALAECLTIDVDDLLDRKTGLGRIGTIRHGPVPLGRFARLVMERLGLHDLRIVNYQEDRPVERVGVVSGFGLRPDLIGIALERGVDLYVSGDLTHPGAIRAKNEGIVLVDATHHATELPGLYRLGERIAGMGVKVHVQDTGIPWYVSSLHKGIAGDRHVS